MNLDLQRRPSLAHCTIGDLKVDGSAQCFTLEDVVRERVGEPVSAWKIPGETAIPAGRYQITMTHSQRFNRDLPLLNDVPGFVGVRIHPGNTEADTEGCILVGSGVVRDALTESRIAFGALFEKIRDAIDRGEEAWIDVKPAQVA